MSVKKKKLRALKQGYYFKKLKENYWAKLFSKFKEGLICLIFKEHQCEKNEHLTEVSEEYSEEFTEEILKDKDFPPH